MDWRTDHGWRFILLKSVLRLKNNLIYIFGDYLVQTFSPFTNQVTTTEMKIRRIDDYMRNIVVPNYDNSNKNSYNVLQFSSYSHSTNKIHYSSNQIDHDTYGGSDHDCCDSHSDSDNCRKDIISTSFKCSILCTFGWILLTLL